MRDFLAIGVAACLFSAAAAAEQPKEAYGSALLCAATPVALRDNMSPDGYGGKPDPQEFATVIDRSRSLAIKAGKDLGDNDTKVDADIKRKAADLGRTLKNSASLPERHEFQSKLGQFMILCAIEKK